MIKIHFSVKEKRGEDKEILGKISSIGLHFIHQPDVMKGVVRHISLKDDTFNRLKKDQVVITSDGIGIIKGDCTPKIGEDGKTIPWTGVNVRVRNLGKNKIFYNLSNVKVINIVNAETGDKHPAIEEDYPYLLIDDSPVEFVTDLKRRARLSLNSKRKLAILKTFTKKVNGLQILNLLIKKGIDVYGKL